MHTPPVSKSRAALGVSESDFTRWKRILDELPDLRFEKVRATRAALRSDCYDDEEILDEAVQRMCREIGMESSPPGSAS